MKSTFQKPPLTLQELSSKNALFCLKIKSFIQTLVGEEPLGSIVVGCSGGADSVALSLTLKCLGFTIIIAHLDHNLREESALDARYAESFAQALSVPYVSKSVDVTACREERGVGIEEAGRIARYDFLEQVRKDYNARWIALGHHLDDLCEDVLLRLIRGTGWPGLAGMKAVDENRFLLRPFLNTRRSALERFLAEENIGWVEDASNKDTSFKRNRARHTLLPLLEEENPKFFQAVHGLWLLAQEDERFWRVVLEETLLKVSRQDWGYWVPREALVSLPKAARLRVYFEVVRKLCLSHGRLDTFFLLDGAIMEGAKGKLYQFSNGVAVRVDTLGVRFFRDQKKA